VVAAGWLLGGVFGVGTLLYAVAIGPLAQLFLPLFTPRRPATSAASPATSTPATAAPVDRGTAEPLWGPETSTIAESVSPAGGS
jgi:hypothetical protein